MAQSVTAEDSRSIMINVLDSQHSTPWFDTHRAAGYLGCTYGTLKSWRALGRGPRYHAVNGNLVRYHVDDLDAFIRGEANR